jgi:hypothetical protein
MDPEDRPRALALIRDLRDPHIQDEDAAPRLDELERLTGCPHVLDLLLQDDPELTDDEALDRALEYRPFAL